MSDRICYCGKALLLVFRKLRSRMTVRLQSVQFFGFGVAPNHASSLGKRFEMTSCELLPPKSFPIFCLLNLHILCRNWLLTVVWCEFRISIKCQICEFVRRCVTFGWALGGILLAGPEKCCTVVDFWAATSLTPHASFNLRNGPRRAPLPPPPPPCPHGPLSPDGGGDGGLRHVLGEPVAQAFQNHGNDTV